jgi:hypothetical protein
MRCGTQPRQVSGVSTNVLHAHWDRNGVPTPPSAAFLHHRSHSLSHSASQSLPSLTPDIGSQASTLVSTQTPLSPAPNVHAKRNSKTSEGTNPRTASFYPPRWQDVISMAKLRHRNHIALVDAFPQATSITGESKDAMECLTEALAVYRRQGLDVEPGTPLLFISCQMLIYL